MHFATSKLCLCLSWVKFLSTIESASFGVYIYLYYLNWPYLSWDQKYKMCLFPYDSEVGLLSEMLESQPGLPHTQSTLIHKLHPHTQSHNHAHSHLNIAHGKNTKRVSNSVRGQYRDGGHWIAVVLQFRSSHAHFVNSVLALFAPCVLSNSFLERFALCVLS